MQIQEKVNSGLVGLLRARTRELHDQAEAAMRIMDESLTVADYEDRLARLYSFFTELETQLRCRVAEEKHPDIRPHLARLAEDLEFLSGQAPEAKALIGTEDFFSSLDDPYRRIGVFYVLEGSALGGQIVSKHIRNKFNFPADKGTAYFFGDGPRTYEIWKAKIAEMGRYDGSPDICAMVLDGAEKTFGVFIKMFAPNTVRG